MTNGNSNDDNSTSDEAAPNILKRFRLETKGCCFLCFGEIQGDAEAGGDNESSSVSLHQTFLHLQVDMGNVVGKLTGGNGGSNGTGPSLPSSSYSSLLERTEIIASLCNNCKTIEETFVELVEMEKKIRLEKRACLERLGEQLGEPERNERRRKEYRQRMTSDIGSLLFLQIVDELRKEVAEKCRQLTSGGDGTHVVDSAEPSTSTSTSNDTGTSTGNNDEQNRRKGSSGEPSERKYFPGGSREPSEPKLEQKIETELETPRNQANTAGEIMLVDISSDEEEDKEQVKAPAAGPPAPPLAPETTSTPPPNSAQTCPVCGDQFKFTIGLIRHMKRTGHQDPGATTSIPPGTSGEGSSQRSDIPNKNSATCSTTPTIITAPEDPNPPEKRFECDTCGKLFSHNYKLNTHRFICSGAKQHNLAKNHKCDICGNHFANPATVRAHIRNVHHATRQFECDLCGKKFKKVTTLNTHRREIHFPVRFKCNSTGCDKSFARRYYLILHKKKDHGSEGDGNEGSEAGISIPAPPASSIAEEVAYNLDMFPVAPSQALRAPQEDPLLLLPYDSHQSYSQPQAPEVEAGDPEKKSRHRCELCHQRYSSRTNLRMHQVTCDGTPRRPYGTLLYECKMCGKGFSNKRTLTRHRYRVHLGLKRWPCEICKKEFKSKAGLAGHHEAVHVGVTFQCEVAGCGKVFKSKRYLKIHETLNHSSGNLGNAQQLPSVTTATQPEGEDLNPLHYLDVFLGNEEAPGPSGMGSETGNAENGNETRTTPRKRKSGGRRLRFSVPTCYTCGKRFSSERNVTRHHNAVHLGLRYGCPVTGCGKTYTDRMTLKNHLERSHAQVQEQNS